MIANVSPASSCVQETLGTLGFARRAKQIRNKVRRVPPRGLLCSALLLCFGLWTCALPCWWPQTRSLHLCLLMIPSACCARPLPQAVVNEDTSTSALELMREVQRLKAENAMLREVQEVSGRVAGDGK